MHHASAVATPFTLHTARGHFRVVIDGATNAPAVVLSNSLGTTLEMWAPQVEAFAQHHRVIRYDTRGHGGSIVTPGPYSMADLGQDVVAILDALDVSTTAFCGVSMGGHTGLWLGVHAGQRLRKLVVCNSAARIGTAQVWQDRAASVRVGTAMAMQALADTAPGRWFSPAFVRDRAPTVQAVQAVLATISPEGYAACCEALALSDLRSELSCIATPTLLVAGEVDPVTTVTDAQAMQAAITGARTVVLPASHLSNIEAAQAFTAAVLPFLNLAARA
ncbi:3-oxoadipate enol-lactonase [Curvibacter sp. CHRR-16]|uniref:3-oxoadipate enol-lactonase n=1 Tax=Curvibacter sp. CHRR-16 TaxID=2835872 RepID=UPI001BD96D47|nr:3-oxoadipate enol-lactonase [Curvibacter sp. CHRR-16]MBT0570515.1 3-oxoadipate enol-lactonase [Curvibacter sp. CHRR-16]